MQYKKWQAQYPVARFAVSFSTIRNIFCEDSNGRKPNDSNFYLFAIMVASKLNILWP